MSVGIGGAGSKLAVLFDPEHSIIVNISEVELSKVNAKEKILAVVHSKRGQFKGSGKNPLIGKMASVTIEEQLLNIIKGEIVFTSTGGGTGSGITSVLLKKLSEQENIPLNETTVFAFILPYLGREPIEYVENTIDFLMDSVSPAIDAGSTGNIFLFTNKLKFERKMAEPDFNEAMIAQLKEFYAIPEKNSTFELIDGHIDYEDFRIYTAKPYFNHFMIFEYQPDKPLDDQIKENKNPFLLPPEQPIEALFLLEIPKKEDVGLFYDLLEVFAKDNVIPVSSVVLNESLQTPKITLSILYSRKPKELVEDFRRLADEMTRKKLKKSLDQYVKLDARRKSIEEEVKQLETETGTVEGVLDVLKRLRKLR